jgi:dephospho-CoA kinase
LLVGITGNIGSGKSTLCKFLSLRGYPVFSADDFGKEVLRKGAPGYARVVEAFGSGILREDGEIDTKRLGRIVFSEPEKLELLTSITHPLIKEKILEVKEVYSGSVAFVEAAVMVEYGWTSLFDRVVLVFAYKGQRLLRAARRFGLKEAVRRDSLQLPYSEKLKYCHFLICNTADLLHLKEQADYLLKELEGNCSG